MGYLGMPEGACLDEPIKMVRNIINGEMERYGTTWRLDESAYRALAKKTGGHISPLVCAIYMLNPKPGQVVTENDIDNLGIDGNDFENWQYCKDAERLMEETFRR